MSTALSLQSGDHETARIASIRSAPHLSAALATDIDDGVATEPVQGPSPSWVDVSQQEYPRQRRRLQLISQSSRVSSAGAALHVDVGEDEMRVSADHDSEFDTESFPANDRRIRRRLSLQWRADPDDVADVADSHDRRFLRVRRAMQLERRQEQFDELAADPQPLGPFVQGEVGRRWTVDLQAEFRCRVRCLQAVPSFLRGQFRMALVTSLEAMRAAYHSGDHTKKCRSWKLFRLTSRMLLWRQKQRGPTKAELERRVDLFHRQEWTLLLDEARHSSSSLRRKISPLTIEEEGVRRARRAEILVHQGEVSRARQVLCSQAKAPGNQATLNELRDPERRPPQLSEAIPPEVSGYCPQHQFKLDWRKYACNLRCAPRGSAAGLAGDTNEHLKVLLDDEQATLLITEAAEHLSTADLPKEIADATGLGSLTALLKENGSIRGIVTGDTFRRGVARTMAQQCAKIFEEACMPYQYALSTRAGTDCVARVVRLLTELDPKKTLLSIDGIGAFDHIKRKSMLEALHNNPALAPLLPFVRTFYGKNSTYVWYDDEGVPHEISQGEGASKGTPSCRRCMLWVSTQLSLTWTLHYTKGRCSLRSSTTSTSSVIPPVLVRSSSKLSSRSPGLRVSK